MKRSRYQGVTNIIRFNPAFFIIAIVVIVLTSIAVSLTSGWLTILLGIGLTALVASLTLSLAASYWVYDLSVIYQLNWIKPTTQGSTWLNINAGFDEASPTILEKFQPAHLRVMDFYDPEKHTEPSIARARKVYPPSPETEVIPANSLPAEDSTVDRIIAMFSLHEIRDQGERVTMLKEFHRVLSDEGEIYITEHLRDVANFAVYSIGALHFHSRKEWLSNFSESQFQIKEETKTTLFVTTFTLIKK